MFWYRHEVGQVAFAFTDAHVDLTDLGVSDARALAAGVGADDLAFMRQVHGRTVARAAADTTPEADALVLDTPGTAAVVRVADCTPIVLVAPDRPLAAVVHAGRVGMLDGVVPAAVDALRAGGATRLEAWVGPRACGRCYEVPQDMADAAAAIVPAAAATTSWGTPAIDVGAGVVAQLEAADVTVHDIGRDACTIEDPTFFSYRRQGAASGRFGALVALAGDPAVTASEVAS